MRKFYRINLLTKLLFWTTIRVCKKCKMLQINIIGFFLDNFEKFKTVIIAKNVNWKRYVV